MIFLGAGASKGLGIPTLQEFSEYVLNELKKRGHEVLINEIIESLLHFNITPDFESLYSILEGLADPISAVKRAGPLTAFFVRNKSRLPQKQNFLEILEDLKRIIYDKCNLDRNKINQIVNLYDPLFNTISNHGIVSDLTFGEHKYGHRPLHTTIVTTNYDMSLELYFLHKRIKYVDGFDETSYPIIKEINPFIIENPFETMSRDSQCKHLLIKLHGSIWQFEKDGSQIKTIMDPHNSPTPISIGKEMMIYPTKEKEILNYNYYPFFNLFKKIKWSLLLVIGYSFRDEPINNVILENLRFNKKAKIIIFNPNPEKVIQNLSDNLVKSRVVTIRQKFGTSSGNTAIKDLRRYVSILYDDEY